MKRFVKLIVVLCAVACSVFAQSGSNQPVSLPEEPENHAFVVERLLRYHDSGEYDWAIREVANSARDYLKVRIANRGKDEKFAAVFDIDETAVSNWQAMSDCGFCSYPVEAKLYSDAHDPAILPVLELFNDAKKNGIGIFFVTGRPNAERDVTIKDLNEAGYEGWSDLMMRPDGNHLPARVFKSDQRRLIEERGYRIILNIGDQASDLAGCCAERVFKLPNPFYLVQ